MLVADEPRWALRASVAGASADGTTTVSLPLLARSVRFGRAVRRARDDENDGEAATAAAALLDPWHVDLGAVARSLTGADDAAKCISRVHFEVLQAPARASDTEAPPSQPLPPPLLLVPRGRNMLRVNGAVVYAAPRALREGDRIALGPSVAARAATPSLELVVVRA
jgi:hypothetical protein